MLLLAVPEAVSSHTKTRSRSAVQSTFCVAPRCPKGSLVPYKSEANQFHPVLALLGTGAMMVTVAHQKAMAASAVTTGPLAVSKMV